MEISLGTGDDGGVLPDGKYINKFQVHHANSSSQPWHILQTDTSSGERETQSDKETNELVISIPASFLVCSVLLMFVRVCVCVRVRVTEGRCGDGKVGAPMTFAMMASMSRNKTVHVGFIYPK